MLKTYLVLLFLGHVIGDFYLQTSKMAEEKVNSLKYFAIHCVLYALSVTVVLIPIWSRSLLPVVIVLLISHLLIDSVKVLLTKWQWSQTDNGRYNKETKLFLIDQLLHAIMIFVVAIYMVKKLPDISFHTIFIDGFKLFNLDYKYVISLSLLFLINAKPYNIVIKKLLNKGMVITESTDSVKGTGAAIGTLERWIIIIFFLMSQYSSIGLVLTAKSIARYNKISENEVFAEYYLLGTLISTILAVVSAILIK